MEPVMPSLAGGGATILVVDDIATNRNLLRETLEPQGYEVLLAGDGEAALKAAKRAQPDVILLDVVMPGLDGFETCRRLKQHPETSGIPVIFISALSETRSLVEGFQAGGIDYVSKPFQADEILSRVKTHLENARLTRAVLEKNRELERINAQLRLEMARREKAEASLQSVDDQLSLISHLEAERWGLTALVGRSPLLARILDQVRKLQPLPNTSVLVLGESGTGKELVARAIHFGSPRAKGPFLTINCSAIPAELAESLLFGHTKGAFSGANTERKGFFENAHGGTLFLDEIGEMPLLLQSKLLRVLETGRVLALGEAQERPVDVRIIAATNADLAGEISAGHFREDLYFRLARFVVVVPPLRERREDIALLARHFVGALAVEMGMKPPALLRDALAALESYDYPGNIRELKNLIERALIESGGSDIALEHLHFVFGLNPRAAEMHRRSSGWPAAERANDAAACAGGTHSLVASTSVDEEERILGYVKEHGTITNARCRELLSVGIHRAWYLLSKMQRNGRLVQDSSRRWAQYRLP
jgi:DNA-binding NtrC family response regulator